MNKNDALNFLNNLAEGIASIFGSYCETVVQEIDKGSITTVTIFNGHVSGRKVGSQEGILGGKLEAGLIDFDIVNNGAYNQFVKHPKGKTIKYSSFKLEGDDYCLVLGINYDVTAYELIEPLVNSIMNFEGDLINTLSKQKENSVESIFAFCMKPFSITDKKLNKKDRLALIKSLNENNFFQMQKSVQYLSEQLEVSKYTIYKDLNELEIT